MLAVTVAALTMQAQTEDRAGSPKGSYGESCTGTGVGSGAICLFLPGGDTAGVVIVVDTVARIVAIWTVVVTSVIVANLTCVDVDDTVSVARRVSMIVVVRDSVRTLLICQEDTGRHRATDLTQ